jgi:hypothetical protein
MLIFFSSPLFYTQYVHLPPVGIPTPPIILNSPKFYPFFKDTLGAIDGTHINCSASPEMRQAACDRKGGVTQNCLAICGFDIIFYYIFSGWDGSAAVTTSNNVSELSLYSRSVLSEVLLSTVVD